MELTTREKKIIEAIKDNKWCINRTPLNYKNCDVVNKYFSSLNGLIEEEKYWAKRDYILRVPEKNFTFEATVKVFKPASWLELTFNEFKKYVLMEPIEIDWSKVEAGTKFKAKIYNQPTEGRIQKNDGRIYLCQNLVNGGHSVFKFEYSYSWCALRGSISDLKSVGVSDLELENVESINLNINQKKDELQTKIVEDSGTVRGISLTGFSGSGKVASSIRPDGHKIPFKKFGGGIIKGPIKFNVFST